MEAKEIGGAIAGGLIATELLDTLISKGYLSRTEARDVLRRAIKSIGPSAPLRRPAALAALGALKSIVEERFPEDK